MEYFVVAIILYLTLRATANLVRLLGGKDGASAGQGKQGRQKSSRPQRWEGPSPRQQTGTARGEPTFWGEDIEDATWHDVENGARSRRNVAR